MQTLQQQIDEQIKIGINMAEAIPSLKYALLEISNIAPSEVEQFATNNGHELKTASDHIFCQILFQKFSIKIQSSPVKIETKTTYHAI